MTTPRDYLFKLLPVYYRDLDNKQGGDALHDLLGVMNEQFNVVEADLDQMLDDWFIETCADWAVPYIGDLVGWQMVRTGDVDAQSRNAALLRWLAPRSDVANTLRDRRRKGTLALLKDIARDVAGWPALAIEVGFREWLLTRTDEVHRHLDAATAPRTGSSAFADVRDTRALARLGTALDAVAHFPDVRNTARADHPPLNVPSVALHVWRLQAFSITHTSVGKNIPDLDAYRFSSLGNDAPLYSPPAGVGELTAPHALTLDEISERIPGDNSHWPKRVSADVYGPGKAFAIYAPNWPSPGAPQPVPRERIIPADLRDWSDHARPAPGYIAVDPELGRLMFPEGKGPDPDPKNGGVFVTWHQGFSAPMGGGEYPRSLSQRESAVIYKLTHKQSLQEGLALWRQDPRNVKDAIIEFECSGVFNGTAHIELKHDETLQVRAAQNVRPVLRLIDPADGNPTVLLVDIQPGAQLVFDGLIIANGPLMLRQQQSNHHIAQPCPASAIIRHCTLVPGWTFACDGGYARPDKDSVIVEQFSGRLSIQHSIVGSIGVAANEAANDPAIIEISDSIVDSAHPEQAALYDNNFSMANPDEGPWAHVVLTVRRSTVFGRVQAHQLLLAENSIFRDSVCVARRQPGCVRFSWLPPCSRTGKRYECQPEKAMRHASPDAPMEGCGCHHTDCAAAQALGRVQPRFVSERYGDPAYSQLHLDTPTEIRHGADDGSEMGAFHDLFQPQREANLRAHLEESVPATCTAAIVFQS